GMTLLIAIFVNVSSEKKGRFIARNICGVKECSRTRNRYNPGRNSGSMDSRRAMVASTLDTYMRVSQGGRDN
ncbi:MAG: hypothetical protein MK240_01235, partial [Opitutales bacterium]|nr:hypothetical protein [Opitutales bacterium]